MTNLSRIIAGCTLAITLCVPSFAEAAEDDVMVPVLPTGTGAELSSGALLQMEMEAEEQRLLWEGRMQRTDGFWANYMNNRKPAQAFKDQHSIRREKRKEKRLQCRNDVRRANRDTLLSETLHCFRATLTMDLEILRKQQQYVESMAGITDKYRTSATFHIQNLMDAISTIVQAIDAGVYASKEELLEAKINLESHYRQSKRMAMAELRIDRSKTWVEHLMVRLHSVLIFGNPEEEVVSLIEESMSCLEQKEQLLDGLFGQEDHNALIDNFRQAQSEIKFCTEKATEAYLLNKELEQEEEENE